MTPDSEKFVTSRADPARRDSGRVLLGFALVSAVVLLVIDGPNAPLLLDEHVSYWIAGRENPGTLVTRSLEYSATPPLTFVLQQTSLSESQPQPYHLRLVSWMGFLLGIACVFLVGRDLGGPFCGGAAALLLAWNPEILDLMRVGRPYGLSVGLSALSLWAMVKLFDHPHSLVRAGILGITQALLLWTHYVNLPLVAMQLILLLFDGLAFRLPEKDCPDRSAILLCFAICGVAIVPLLAPMLRMQELSEFLNYRADPVSFRDAIHPLWWIGVPAGLLTIGALAFRKESADPGAIHDRAHVVSSLVLMGVVPVLALWGASHWWEAALGEVRYRAVYAPALSLLVCVIFCRVSKSAERPLAGVVACLAIAWIMQGMVPWRSSLSSDPAANDWRGMAENLQENGREGDPIFVYSGLIESRLVNAYFADPIFMDYAACRMGRFYIPREHPRIAIPYTVASTPELNDYYLAQTQAAGQSGRSIWLAVSIDTDLGQLAEREISRLILAQGFEIVAQTDTLTARLIQFRLTSPELPE